MPPVKKRSTIYDGGGGVKPAGVGGGGRLGRINPVKSQNKAAKTYVTKLENDVDRGRRAAQTRKDNEERRLIESYNGGKRSGFRQGVATGTATGAGVVGGSAIKKKKNKQAKGKKK